jgi:hypothetical protein
MRVVISQSPEVTFQHLDSCIYGTFPTAPTVFVFSNQYNIAMDVVSNSRDSTVVRVIFMQVASSIVLCTFMSAPIMYVSARLVLITKASV